MKKTILPRDNFKGELTIPGDKSISHRGVIFGAISEGITELDGFLTGADCISTIGCFRAMGIDIEQKDSHVVIHGKGLHGLTAPSSSLDVGNSGTTTRLISGILSGQSFSSNLVGDDSLQSRPMKRIMEPLSLMGADITSDFGNGCVPLTIKPATKGLKAISYTSPVSSAQVKSCILLAGLYADGITSVTEATLSRNHTELMLKGFGADITSDGCTATVAPNPKLLGQKIMVPGDISSAAYFIALGLLAKHGDIYIKNVNTNPTRAGILKVAKLMGGNIAYENKRLSSSEEVCDLHITSSELKGITIEGDLIPTLIDEIPMIAVMAACAKGTTVIKDAAELKVKESDRIATVVENLTAMGVDITATEDGMIINGCENRLGSAPLYGANIKTYLDHRIAMAFAIAGCVAEGETTLDHPECVDISYPSFYETLESLR